MKNKKLLIFLLIISFITIFIIPLSGLINNSAFADNEKSVYLGGDPIGVNIVADGVIITKLVEVATLNGNAAPAKIAGLQEGDMIVKIGNKEILNITDIKDVLKAVNKENNSLEIEYLREDILKKCTILPLEDILAKEFKLGILAKNDISGVGTLTYIRQENYRFGGLGHQILDSAIKSKNVYKFGEIYPCNVIGTVKGTEGKAGELKGVFNKQGKSIGKLDKNTQCGIYGNTTKEFTLLHPLVTLGSKDEVKNGNAYVYTTIFGNTPEKYSIEIIKANAQSSSAEKGMVIRITDERLLDKAGGIVQGMSGSPIVQNDKLIGAITHVFLNDPTKGYGIYIDWMINN